MFASVIESLLIAPKFLFVEPGAQWDQRTCLSWDVVISAEFPATLTQKFAPTAAELKRVRLNRRQLLLLLFIAGSLYNDMRTYYYYYYYYYY
jgi:hypothetical protein